MDAYVIWSIVSIKHGDQRDFLFEFKLINIILKEKSRRIVAANIRPVGARDCERPIKYNYSINSILYQTFPSGSKRQQKRTLPSQTKYFMI